MTTTWKDSSLTLTRFYPISEAHLFCLVLDFCSDISIGSTTADSGSTTTAATQLMAGLTTARSTVCFNTIDISLGHGRSTLKPMFLEDCAVRPGRQARRRLPPRCFTLGHPYIHFNGQLCGHFPVLLNAFREPVCLVFRPRGKRELGEESEVSRLHTFSEIFSYLSYDIGWRCNLL